MNWPWKGHTGQEPSKGTDRRPEQVEPIRAEERGSYLKQEESSISK